MKNTEIQRIITLFKETFEGPAWHGPAVKEVLKGISAEQSLRSFDDGHNIAELVFHITAWRTFLINELKGLEKYDVSEEENFIKIENINEQEWQNLQEKLNKSQSELLALLNDQEDSILEQRVGKRNYNFYVLMHGVIQHDLYHLGQIIMLKKYS